MNKRFALYLLLLCLVLFIGCQNSAENSGTYKTAPGVNSTHIVLGSSLALSGHAGYLGRQTKIGSEIYIRHINKQGGVNGRKIKLIYYDDRYDPPPCLANTQRLIVKDKVFALFCYVGTPTTVKVIPMIQKAEIPLLGMFTGANALRDPFKKWLINVRPPYYAETEAAVKHIVDELGMERIAVFYQYDAYGFDGLTGTELALQEFDLEPVARSSYIRGTMDVKDSVQKIADSDAQAVFLIGTYNPSAKFIRLAAEQNYHPLYYTVSFVGAKELARRLKNVENKEVILSQVVPPQMSSYSEAPRKSGYIRLLNRYYPEQSPNCVGLEAFMNARVMVEGLRRCGKQLTREKFISAIESIQGYSLGEDCQINFGPRDHQGLEDIYFTRLTEDNFILLRDWGKLLDNNSTNK